MTARYRSGSQYTEYLILSRGLLDAALCGSKLVIYIVTRSCLGEEPFSSFIKRTLSQIDLANTPYLPFVFPLIV